MIDITMTAVRRPKVIDKTLKSFTKHIFKNQKDYRLIINIDPVGEGHSNNKVIDVCEKYFENLVALLIAKIIKPVAIGSRVPKCPTFFNDSVLLTC